MGPNGAAAACALVMVTAASGCAPRARDPVPFSIDAWAAERERADRLAERDMARAAARAGHGSEAAAPGAFVERAAEPMAGAAAEAGGRASAAAYTAAAAEAVAGRPAYAEPLVQTVDSGRGGPVDDRTGPEPVSLREDALADRASPSDPGSPTLTLRWPLPATGVTSLFGPRRDPITGAERFHYGLDLQGTYGQLVRAVGDGQVVFAGWNEGHGRMVVIAHAGGWQSSYSHLAQLLVGDGQVVRGGQSIGQLGNSGRSTGPHLHLEITRWDSYHDPLDLLGRTVDAHPQ